MKQTNHTTANVINDLTKEPNNTFAKSHAFSWSGSIKVSFASSALSTLSVLITNDCMLSALTILVESAPRPM